MKRAMRWSTCLRKSRKFWMDDEEYVFVFSDLDTFCYTNEKRDMSGEIPHRDVWVEESFVSTETVSVGDLVKDGAGRVFRADEAFIARGDFYLRDYSYVS